MTQGDEVFGVILVLLGLALVAWSVIPTVKSSPWYRRRIKKRREMKTEKRRSRCRKEHRELIQAWEHFYERHSLAASYAIMARDGVQEARPLFLHHLREARAAAAELPETYKDPKYWIPETKQRILVYLDGIEGAAPQVAGEAESRGPSIDLQNFLMDVRRMRMIPLYKDCGQREPNWPGRVRPLSKDELREVTPPVDPQFPKSN